MNSLSLSLSCFFPPILPSEATVLGSLLDATTSRASSGSNYSNLDAFAARLFDGEEMKKKGTKSNQAVIIFTIHGSRRKQSRY